MQTKCNLLLILLLLHFFANAQDDLIASVASIDSILIQMESYNYDEWYAFSRSTKGNILKENQAIAYSDSIRVSLEQIISTIDKPLAQAICYDRLADLHEFRYKKANFADTTILYRQRAIAEYQKTDARNLLPFNHIDLAISYKNFGEYDLGEQHIFKAIALFEEKKYPYGIFLGYRNLCDFCRHKKTYSQAIFYGEKAIGIAHKTSFEDLPFNPLLCLITAYRLNGNLEKSLEAAELYIEHFKSSNKKIGYGYGMSYMLNEQAETYLSLGCEQEAINSYETIMQLYDDIDSMDFFDSDYHMNYLFLKKEYRKALPLLLKAVNEFLDVGNKEFPIPIFQKIITCYQELGDFEKASKYYKQLLEYIKKAHGEELKATQNELLVKYQTEKKESTIALQTQKIDQQKTTAWFFMAIAGLLGLFLMVLYRNYTNKQKLNKQLQATNDALDTKNQQNELLLKEIHHRVKNNLEVVSSLLALQSRQLDDQNAKSAMQESQNRVQSMGIIHQKLYQGENLAAIEMKDYFVNLGEGVLDSFGKSEQVKITCVMKELELDVDTAVPIGLIVNELLTNALKYAFVDEEHPEIQIQLERLADDSLQLKVSDNGIGKSNNEVAKGTGFGSQLVQLLTAQLEGAMGYVADQGSHFSFHFKLSTE